MHQPRNFIYVLVLATILAVSPDRAWAHAIIVESTPKMNGMITEPLLKVKLRFNSQIDDSRSKLTLVSRDGTSHAMKLSQQTSPDLLLAEVPNLHPGKYQLHWQVLASDGHITRGSIPFSVVL